MKTKLKLFACAPVLALACSSTALAMQSTAVENRTLVIEAISQPMLVSALNEVPSDQVRFTIRITEEPNPMLLADSQPEYNYVKFLGATKEISIEVHDESDQLVFEQTQLDADEFCDVSGGEAEFRADGGEQESFDIAIWGTRSCPEAADEEFRHVVFLDTRPLVMPAQIEEPSPVLAQLFESWDYYPTLNTGEIEVSVMFTSFGRGLVQVLDTQTAKQQQTAFEELTLTGRTTFISYEEGVDDSDGDGIADDIDLCSSSLMDETVIFGGWLDSTVTNHVDDSGCTIMDRYAKCTPEEQEQPSRFSRFQPRYSGPSYCEKQVSYGLVDEGIIDYTEARMLRDALYMSYRSQPR
ncbi:hypothetical protein [Pseudidiomarina sp. YC-516-91]|uniref:hypothetical protein n=1 Tax=Pseudidiomarina salilacus TaxID=3384452 RepID=UPI0039848BDB